MTKFEDKVIAFAVAFSNTYKEPAARDEIPKLDFVEEDLIEDFTAMLLGLMAFYYNVTKEKVDVLGFINILIRSTFQHSAAERDE